MRAAITICDRYMGAADRVSIAGPVAPQPCGRTKEMINPVHCTFLSSLWLRTSRTNSPVPGSPSVDCMRPWSSTSTVCGFL